MKDNENADPSLPKTKRPTLRLQDIYLKSIFNTQNDNLKSNENSDQLIGNKKQRENTYVEEELDKINKPHESILIREAVKYSNINNTQPKEKGEKSIQDKVFNSILIPHSLRGKNKP